MPSSEKSEIAGFALKGVTPEDFARLLSLYLASRCRFRHLIEGAEVVNL